MIVKPSVMFEDMRKSAGGVTASKNKSRLYVKNRISPRNPRTAAQLDVRASLSDHSKKWSDLTQAQRDAWNEAAKSTTGRRELGEAAKISGFNFYVRCNNNLALINSPLIDAPAQPAATPSFEISSLSVIAATDSKAASITMNLSSVPTDFIVRATAPFSAGKASDETGLRIIAVNPENNPESGIDLTAAYTAKFGSSFKKGEKIQFEVYAIDSTSGTASLRQTRVEVVF